MRPALSPVRVHSHYAWEDRKLFGAADQGAPLWRAQLGVSVFRLCEAIGAMITPYAKPRGL